MANTFRGRMHLAGSLQRVKAALIEIKRLRATADHPTIA